jgi:hypothetical protein
MATEASTSNEQRGIARRKLLEGAAESHRVFQESHDQARGTCLKSRADREAGPSSRGGTK